MGEQREDIRKAARNRGLEPRRDTRKRDILGTWPTSPASYVGCAKPDIEYAGVPELIGNMRTVREILHSRPGLVTEDRSSSPWRLLPLQTHPV